MERLDDRYSVGERIGRGGVGEVFRGLQTTLQRPVAIKILRRELSFKPTSVARFKREAYTTSRLNHPNIVTVYDIGHTDDQQPFVVMELLSGQTLGERIREMNTLPVEEVLQIAQQVIRGMAAGQGVGLVHRDLKPDNIFILEHGLVKVLDFGLATLLEASPIKESQSRVQGDTQPPPPAGLSPKSTADETLSHFTLGNTKIAEMDSDSGSSPVESIELDLAREGRLTRPGALVGTPRYMAPEQVLGWEVDHRTDLYAFGIILYEALSGATPFGGNGIQAIMRQHLHTAAAPLYSVCPDTPRALCQIVDRLLAKDPSDRYEDWTSLGTAIRPLLRGTTEPKTPSAAIQTERDRPKEPFRFLHAFNETSSQIFFGRDQDAQRFQESWQHSDIQPLFILCGSSGVGKSSFLGARICPYLADTGHQVIRITGTAAPMDQVRAVALARLAREGIREEGGSLTEVLARLQRRMGRRMTIVLDQLEEVFTTGSQAQQRHFQAELASLVMGGEGQIRVLLSLREDYLGQLLRTLHPLPVDQLSRTQVLRPLAPADIAQALRSPGQPGLDVDYSPFEWERGLVDEIVEDLMTDDAGEVAPRIQAVGARLWEMIRDTPLPHRITRRHYREGLAGSRGILSRILDDAIDAQPSEDRGAAKELLRALTHLPGSPTSRPTPSSVLLAFSEDRPRRERILGRLESPWRVIHGYTDPRWPEERSFRIAHEALVLRIQQYGDETSELNRARQVFSHGLSLWLQGGRDDDDLLPDGHFDLVQKHIDSLVIHTDDEVHFYEACLEVLNAGWDERHRAEKRRRFKQRILVSLVPILALSIGFVLGQAPVEYTTANQIRARLLDTLSVQSADLSDLSLRGANLSGLELVAPDLSGSDLRNADLSDSQIPSADLSEAQLDGANFKRTDLRGAVLRDASVLGASFAYSDLSSALLDIDSSKADFTGAIFNLGTTWRDGPPVGALGPRGDIRDQDLRGLDIRIRFDSQATTNLEEISASRVMLQSAFLDGAHLRLADLTDSQLAGASLVGVFLERSTLDGADLRGADLSGASLQFASLRGADLRGAQLVGTLMNSADLTGADLCGANLSNASVEGTTWDDASACADTRWPQQEPPL